MSKHRFDFSIRKSVVCIATLAAFGFVSNPAAAKTNSIKYVSFSALAATCGKVQGTMASQGGGNYSCSKGCGPSNQDNRTCSVECNSNTKTCTGTTPARTATWDPLQILTGGVGVVKTSGNGSPSNSGGLLGDGILGSSPGMGTSGPSATGSPVSGGGRAPAAAPIQLR